MQSHESNEKVAFLLITANGIYKHSQFRSCHVLIVKQISKFIIMARLFSQNSKSKMAVIQRGTKFYNNLFVRCAIRTLQVKSSQQSASSINMGLVAIWARQLLSQI